MSEREEGVEKRGRRVNTQATKRRPEADLNKQPGQPGIIMNERRKEIKFQAAVTRYLPPTKCQ